MYSCKYKKQGIVSQCPGKDLLEAEALLEAIDAAAAVHQLLFAGVEGVALRANFNTHFRFGGTGLESLAANATNDALAILGMDLFLHAISPLSLFAVADS